MTYSSHSPWLCQDVLFLLANKNTVLIIVITITISITKVLLSVKRKKIYSKKWYSIIYELIMKSIGIEHVWDGAKGDKTGTAIWPSSESSLPVLPNHIKRSIQIKTS